MRNRIENLQVSSQPPDARHQLALKLSSPLFLADWDDVVFVHYAIDADLLQPHVPFRLDLHGGCAYVSVVAFTQRRLRPTLGGRIAAALSAPLACHPFLNIRTYVTHGVGLGIYFLSEWIPNRLAALIGPPLYGLPYRIGQLRYHYDRAAGTSRHQVIAAGKRLEFEVSSDPECGPEPALAGTLDEFLLERYTAFTRCRGKNRCFRVWHEPWAVQRVNLWMLRLDLLEAAGLDVESLHLVGASYSPGVKGVQLGQPERVDEVTFAPPGSNSGNPFNGSVRVDPRGALHPSRR